MALAVGDFNRDGYEDVLVLNSFSGYVRIWLGWGGGRFRQNGRLFTGAQPVALALGDLNRDGISDLVVVNRGSRDLYVFAGHEDGTFAFLQEVNVSFHPSAAAVADLNSDGCLDITVTGDLDPYPVTLFGGCQGGFTKQPPLLPSADAGGPYQGRVGEEIELHGTGSTAEGASITRYRWSFGDGAFSEGQVVTHRYTEQGSYEACLMITDSRGLTAFDCAQVRIVGAEEPKPPTPLKDRTRLQRYPVGRDPLSFVVGEFNGDGLQDLAVASGDGTVLIFLNRGGVFSETQRIPLGFRPDLLAALDVDRDKMLDLLVVSGVRIMWLKGKGTGMFWAQPLPLDLKFTFQPEALLVGDLDSDGAQDLVLTDAERSLVTALSGKTLQFRFSAEVGRSPRTLAIGDFNGDGDSDLAVINSLDRSISLLLGRGDGTFTLEREVWAGEFPRSLVAGDFNDDDIDDLIVFDLIRRRLELLLGAHVRPFQRQHPILAPEPHSLMAQGDFNGDGHEDLAIVRSNKSSITIMLGPLIDDRRPLEIQSGLELQALLTADFNGDGQDDLALLGRKDQAGELVILLVPFN